MPTTPSMTEAASAATRAGAAPAYAPRTMTALAAARATPSPRPPRRGPAARDADRPRIPHDLGSRTPSLAALAAPANEPREPLHTADGERRWPRPGSCSPGRARRHTAASHRSPERSARGLPGPDHRTTTREPADSRVRPSETERETDSALQQA